MSSSSSLSQFQSQFVSQLLDTDKSSTAKLCIQDNDDWRFSVYRNNYFYGLIEQLGEAYPAVKNMLGEDPFKLIAHHYLTKFPPNNGSLVLFAENFPDYLKSIPLTQQDELTCDLALIDRAYLEALHAPNDPVLDPHVLTELGEDLVEACLTPNKTLRLVSSNIPLVAKWKHFRMGEEVSVDTNHGAIVTRPGLKVEINPLTSAEIEFGMSLIASDTVSIAHDKAIEVDADFDVTKTFSNFLLAGAFSAVELPNS